MLIGFGLHPGGVGYHVMHEKGFSIVRSGLVWRQDLWPQTGTSILPLAVCPPKSDFDVTVLF